MSDLEKRGDSSVHYTHMDGPLGERKGGVQKQWADDGPVVIVIPPIKKLAELEPPIYLRFFCDHLFLSSKRNTVVSLRYLMNVTLRRSW